MPAVADQLHNYATALSDPIRARILSQLDRMGEATATHIARALGLPANNVYHHMRVLLQMGLLEPPRAVPGATFVEKFYHLTPAAHAALRFDENWFEEQGGTLTAEDRQILVTSSLCTMAHRLQQLARRYEAVDAGELDRMVREEDLLLLSRYALSRRQLESYQASLRTIMEGAEDESGDKQADLVMIAALPAIAGTEADAE